VTYSIDIDDFSLSDDQKQVTAKVKAKSSRPSDASIKYLNQVQLIEVSNGNHIDQEDKMTGSVGGSDREDSNSVRFTIPRTGSYKMFATLINTTTNKIIDTDSKTFNASPRGGPPQNGENPAPKPHPDPEPPAPKPPEPEGPKIPEQWNVLKKLGVWLTMESDMVKNFSSKYKVPVTMVGGMFLTGILLGIGVIVTVVLAGHKGAKKLTRRASY